MPKKVERITLPLFVIAAFVTFLCFIFLCITGGMPSCEYTSVLGHKACSPDGLNSHWYNDLAMYVGLISFVVAGVACQIRDE